MVERDEGVEGQLEPRPIRSRGPADALASPTQVVVGAELTVSVPWGWPSQVSACSRGPVSGDQCSTRNVTTGVQPALTHGEFEAPGVHQARGHERVAALAVDIVELAREVHLDGGRRVGLEGQGRTSPLGDEPGHHADGGERLGLGAREALLGKEVVAPQVLGQQVSAPGPVGWGQLGHQRRARAPCSS